MIGDIILALKRDTHYNAPVEVQIAKGVREYPRTWKAAFDKIRRLWQLRKQ